MAEASIFLMQNYDSAEIVNVGVGTDITIRELAELVAGVVGYSGRINFDSTKPDGTPRKLMDVTRLHSLGWHHRTALEEGIRGTYVWYLENSLRTEVLHQR